MKVHRNSDKRQWQEHFYADGQGYRHREAEKAVIEAAKAWTANQRGWLKPLDEALAQAVDTLREQEAET